MGLGAGNDGDLDKGTVIVRGRLLLRWMITVVGGLLLLLHDACVCGKLLLFLLGK